MVDTVLFGRIMSILTERPLACTWRNISDARDWCAVYAQDIFVECVATDRASAKHMYGRLRGALRELVLCTVTTEARFPCQTASVNRVTAAVSGLGFLATVVVKRDQNFIKEVAPLLPAPLHDALYHGGDMRAALARCCTSLHEMVFEENVGHDQGASYLLLHPDDEEHWYYPGWVQKMVLQGRDRGAPRWPGRLAGHTLATRAPGSRDGQLGRYQHWRDLDDCALMGFPSFRGSLQAAYSREQHIIRAKAPLTVERDQARVQPNSEGEQGSKRRRPLQSARRRQHKEEGRATRTPPLASNFDNSVFVLKQFAVPTLAGGSRPVDFKTYYVNAVRTMSSLTTMKEGPVDITAPGNEKLAAEYLATPAKRVETLNDRLRDDQMFTICRHIPRVVSDYRRRLLRNKLVVAMKTRKLPPPGDHLFGLRRSYMELTGMVAPMMRAIATECVESEEKRKFIACFTRIHPARDHRCPEEMVSEYPATDSFQYDVIASMAPEERTRRERSTDARVLQSNWDTPIAAGRGEIQREIEREVSVWANRFGIWLPPDRRRAYMHRFAHHLQNIPEDVSNRDTPIINYDSHMVGRRDKDEHTLIVKPLLSYHCTLFRMFCQSAAFQIRNWSIHQTLQFMQLQYQLWYPPRFRLGHKFEEADIPVGIARTKAKCTTDGTLSCTRDHEHDRIIVNTRRLPHHNTDRLFARSWEVLKRNDPLPCCEVWGLRDLARQQRESRGQLRVIPRFRNVCAKCGQHKPPITLCRCDCANMFTWADTEHALQSTAPRLQRRVARATGRTIVTVERTHNVRGKIGGHTANTFKRFSVSHAEMHSHLRYTVRMAVFRLGSGQSMIILYQVWGTAMGGRGSKILCSLLLGEGESLMYASEWMQRGAGFWIPEASLRETLSLLRIVDDGGIASTVYCETCCVDFLRETWGRRWKITIEESGPVVKFGDTIEYIVGDRVLSRPFYTASPFGPQLDPLVRTRFIPFHHSWRPVAYARVLFLGAIHRSAQLTECNLTSAERAIWEIVYALRQPVNAYPWTTLRHALRGIRMPWAIGTLRRARLRLEAFDALTRIGRADH